ncbi:uncharacterized protein ACIBXB_006837 [Morphnus guianensis]
MNNRGGKQEATEPLYLHLQKKTFFGSVTGPCYGFCWQTEEPSVTRFVLPKWYLRTVINTSTNPLLMSRWRQQRPSLGNHVGDWMDEVSAQKFLEEKSEINHDGKMKSLLLKYEHKTRISLCHLALGAESL